MILAERITLAHFSVSSAMRLPNCAGVIDSGRTPRPTSRARVFEAWGFQRCLWGTDWTRAFAVVNYEQGVVPFLKTDRLSDSERTMLMSGACAKAYGWSPKKS